MKNFFKKIFSRSTQRTVTVSRKGSARKTRRVPQFDLEKVTEQQSRIKLGLLLLGVFLASGIASRLASVLVKPTYTPLPPRPVAIRPKPRVEQDLSLIEQRNIFDNENFIPEPFESAMLDCWSQARPSTTRINLLGTIVMSDESLSVALIENPSSNQKLAVKKDELFFDNRYQAMSIDRKRLCFQNKSTQDFEYVEIPEDRSLITNSLSQSGASPREGISLKGDNQYQIKQSFLDSQLGDLQNVLQTAKAIPAIEGGKMKGFLIQSIDEDSVFASLGLGAGDVLKEVNGIVLDNAGKGLEAFSALKGSRKIELRVSRGGQDQTISYEVK